MLLMLLFFLAFALVGAFAKPTKVPSLAIGFLVLALTSSLWLTGRV